MTIIVIRVQSAVQIQINVLLTMRRNIVRLNVAQETSGSAMKPCGGFVKAKDKLHSSIEIAR